MIKLVYDFHYTNRCVSPVEMVKMLWAGEHHECTAEVKVDQRNRGNSTVPQQDQPKLDSAERAYTNKLKWWDFPPFVV